MGHPSTSSFTLQPLTGGRRARRMITAVTMSALLAAACDTGDGKTLREPTGTLPPTTVSAETTLVRDAVDTIASVPLAGEVDTAEQLPSDFDGDDFRIVAPWVDGTQIPARHTCDDIDIAPPLSWVAAPADAVDLAVVMAAQDDAGNDAAIHWVLAGLDPSTATVVEGEVPLGAIQALNEFGVVGWTGPCPTPGGPQVTYRFTVYALGQQVELTDGIPAADALAFIEAVAFASSDVLGVYQR